jgi:hypothetical protein
VEVGFGEDEVEEEVVVLEESIRSRREFARRRGRLAMVMFDILCEMCVIVLGSSK